MATLTSSPRASKQTRVVVTGYGCLTSLGENVAETWRSIMEYRVGYQQVSWDDRSITTKFLAKISDNPSRYKKIPKSVLRALPLYAKYALAATAEAIEMAFGVQGQPTSAYLPYDVGVIIGSGWFGLDQAYDVHDEYRDTGVGNSFGTLISMPSIATGACTKVWGIRGYQNSIAAACATGTMAIGDAYEIIRSGRAQCMIAGGSESLRSENNVWNIDILQALTKEQHDIEKACCPFSKGRCGFVLAEGAATLILENRDSALARGATILGEITGYGSFSDASDFTAPAEDMGARIQSIQAALRQAQKEPHQIDYINAHGTSTQLNDLNETKALRAALGAAAYTIPISSTKSYTGHLIGAAGALEAIFCLKTMQDSILPATIHFNTADPECDLDYIPNQHRPVKDVSTALNLSFGFGGTNAALLLEKGV